jgi:hypothetical protein
MTPSELALAMSLTVGFIAGLVLGYTIPRGDNAKRPMKTGNKKA